SLALCLGTSAHIFFRHSRRSSAVWARLYSASASRYCGVRLTATGHLLGLERVTRAPVPVSILLRRGRSQNVRLGKPDLRRAALVGQAFQPDARSLHSISAEAA